MSPFLDKIVSYITFRKPAADDPSHKSFNLRAMHTINKISIFMFILALIFLFLKWVVF